MTEWREFRDHWRKFLARRRDEREKSLAAYMRRAFIPAVYAQIYSAHAQLLSRREERGL